MVTHWEPGVPYGFIVSDGRTWYASERDTPGCLALAPATPVTFTGRPVAPAGKSYPRARAITPEPGALEPAAPAPPGRTSVVLAALVPVDPAALLRLRGERGLTVTALARQCGLRPETIRRLERDTSPRTRHHTLTLLAAALGTTPAALARLGAGQGLTIGALAGRSALSAETISRLEHSAAPRCHRRTVTQLAAALRATPAALTVPVTEKSKPS